jgi:predicted RecB family nuclease
MVKSVDVHELFTKCMKKSTHESLTASTVATCLVSQFTVHCNQFAPEEEKDEISEYDQMLSQKGKEHEVETVRENYPGISQIQSATREDGFKLSLESMISGTTALHGMPIYYLPYGLHGEADIVEKSTDYSSIFGDYHYTIKEVKLAKNIEDRHLIQGAFYNYLLGQIQEFTPKTFSIINGEREETVYEYSDYESLLFETIDTTREILRGGHVSPTHGSGLFPWVSYCNKKAIETNDVSLVAGISAKTKGKFVDHGYKTVQDLARAKLENLIEINGVGKKTAIKYVTTAKALDTNKPIIFDKDAIEFPDCKVEIFLDLEGIDPTMADENTPQIDYLIGILVRENSTEKYIPFTAKDTDHEKEMLLEFLEFIKNQNDYVIYHYHHYEKTHLTKMMDEYEIDMTTQNLVFDNMIDIHKSATNSVIFPTYGNGLKQIAPYLGFKWRHKDVNATESISIYLDFVKNPKENQERFQKVIDYNEDDCVATRVIKDWLVSVK